VYGSKEDRKHDDGTRRAAGFNESLKRITAEHQFLGKRASEHNEYDQCCPRQAVRGNGSAKIHAAENHDRDDGDEHQAGADRAAQAKLPRPPRSQRQSLGCDAVGLDMIRHCQQPAEAGQQSSRKQRSKNRLEAQDVVACQRCSQISGDHERRARQRRRQDECPSRPQSSFAVREHDYVLSVISAGP
jgi:hypothetical protein